MSEETLNIAEAKKVLFFVARKFEACDESLIRINTIQSKYDLIDYLDHYSGWIDVKFDLSVTDAVETIPPSVIVEWFNSPFISEFDKTQVKEKSLSI